MKARYTAVMTLAIITMQTCFAAASSDVSEVCPDPESDVSVEAPIESEPISLNAAYRPVSVSQNSGQAVPRYTFPYQNGLYASVAGYLSVKKVKISNEQITKLNVPGFAESFPVHSVVQNQDAPLVVFLPGIGGRADSDFSKLWPSWFANAGYHVLWFDSTFLPRFNKSARAGVSGNLWEETERIKDVISAYLNQAQIASGKVTRIGVAGMSYGGLEALMLGQLSVHGRLPFKLDAVQAYSPPINTKHTAEIFDEWYRNYRWDYTLVQLELALGTKKPLANDRNLPFSDEMMKAGITAAFHQTLSDAVLENNNLYKLNLLPNGSPMDDEYVKADYADAWGYMKYANDMAFPYWKEKLHLESLDQLIDGAKLLNLLKNQPACTKIIFAHDDPLNTDADKADLIAYAADHPQQVVVLPHGGHVGYVSNRWTKAELLSLFNCSVNAELSPTLTSSPRVEYK